MNSVKRMNLSSLLTSFCTPQSLLYLLIMILYHAKDSKQDQKHSLTYKIFSSIHNLHVSFMHTKLPIGLFQNTQADPRSVKCSVKRPCRGHSSITTVPFLPLFLHPAVPILSGVHGQAEHHLRGRAGCHWTLLEGEIDGAKNYATFFLHHQSGTPETSYTRVLRGGYISHGKL